MIAARLVTPLRVRGMDARVEWQIENVSRSPFGLAPTRRDGAGHGDAAARSSMTFPREQSGPVTIEAGNRYGAVRIDLGRAGSYDIPPFDAKSFIGTLPRLAVPPLDAFTLDALAPALATVPRVAVPEPPRLPTMPTADLTGVFRETLLPLGRADQLPQVRGVGQSLRFPDLGGLIAGPTERSPKSASQAREFAESQRKSHMKALADAEEDD